VTIAPFKITVCGIQDLGNHCDARVTHVLSILDPDWPVPEAFGTYGEHEKLELRFHDVIEERPGVIPPSSEHVRQLLGFGRNLLAASPPEAHLLVHCHAGVSRSTASLALLLAQALPQRPASDIADEVMRIRPEAWPNLRIVEIGDAMLGRDGELIAAASEIYQRRLARDPELAAAMARGERGREIAVARNRPPTH
jgi:predicted protein tyrosine phosphatase